MSITSRGAGRGPTRRTREFFQRAAAGELELAGARLVAFGATRKAGGRAETDPVMADLVGAGTGIVCLVAKSSPWHITETLRTTTVEALDMVADSVAYLRNNGKVVFVDAEHFFDGYLEGPGFCADFLRVVEQCGATPGPVRHQRRDAAPPGRKSRGRGSPNNFGPPRRAFSQRCGCAVANSLAAVRRGADHVQGCINGYGERTGNADLTAVTVYAALYMVGAATDSSEGISHRATSVVVKMHAEPAKGHTAGFARGPFDLVGQHPSVGAAQDRRGAALLPPQEVCAKAGPSRKPVEKNAQHQQEDDFAVVAQEGDG